MWFNRVARDCDPTKDQSSRWHFALLENRSGLSLRVLDEKIIQIKLLILSNT